MWKNGVIQQLDTLPGATFSGASAINNRAQVVGTSDPRPVVWSGRTIIDLGLPAGATSATAAAINDRGDAAGQYNNASGETRAVLWTSRPHQQ